jgi:hypothetical protein
MNCFNHPVQAIGVCKHCQRALCKECCTDLGHGLACKDKHESEVKHYNDLIENAKRAYESAPRTSYFLPIFLIGMGLMFSYFGLKRGFDDLATVMGFGFIAFGIFSLINSLKLIKKITTKY